MKVITFYGADSKVGVTMTAQASAEAFAEKYPNKRILLLHLDGNSGMEYHQKKFDACLDDLKAALLSRVLTSAEVAAACQKKDNLYQLIGISNYSTRKELSPKHVKQLLELLDFDICIIDAGSNFEMGLTIGALLYSDDNYLVTTQQQVPIDRYSNVNEQILKRLGVKFKLLIVNKYVHSIKLDHTGRLEEKYAVAQSAEVPMLDFGWQAEREGESLRAYRSEAYHRAMEGLVKIMVGSAGYLEAADTEVISKNVWKRILGRK